MFASIPILTILEFDPISFITLVCLYWKLTETDHTNQGSTYFKLAGSTLSGSKTFIYLANGLEGIN